MEKQVSRLLNKYIAGTITKEELNELRIWINLSDDEELSYFLYRLWDDFSIIEKNLSEQQSKEMFDTIHRRISRQQWKNLYGVFSKVAAILILPLLLISTLLFPLHIPAEKTVLGEPMSIHTEKGQQSSLTLFDGTNVRLNTSSSLSYRQSYGEKEREVKLIGEAYFEVKKDSLRPFIVRTSQMDVEVLGTSFNMYVYENEIAEMSLISGLVKVTTHTSPQQIVYIHPNEKIRINIADNRWEIIHTDNRFETAWLRGELVFRSIPIKEVFQKLERKYDVQIHLDIPEIENDKFTGSFDSEYITDVMKLLQTHYKFSYTVQGNQIKILPSN